MKMRVVNPFWMVLFAITCKCFSFSRIERVSDSNCIILRSKIRSYVRKRAAGEVKSNLGGESDIISLMLKNTEIFSEDDIIDELLDFMVAGTQTTQLKS